MATSDTSEAGDLGSILATDKRRSRRKKFIVAAVVLLVLGGGGYPAYLKLTGDDSKGQVRFETAAVIRGDLKSTITATGTVEALNTVEVGAEISGQIQTIAVDFNDPVRKGQLLVELDPQQQEAAVAEAKAKVLAARAGQAESKAALLEATQNETRVKALAQRGLASAKDLEAATASAARAKASLASSKASAALSQATYEASVSKLGKTEIRAPIDGMVLSREVEVGQAINAGMQTPVLFVLAEDLRQMRLSSQVDEADIGMVKVGQSASFTVDAYPQREFDSQVISVRNVPVTDQSVVSYEVLLTVDNSELLLKPGMTATVDIITEAQEGALIVPNKALRFKPPSDEASGMRRGPPMPLLGGGKRGGDQKGDKGKARPLAKLGDIGSSQGVVWILEGGKPSPVKVTKLATDGARTAVGSDRLEAGTEVIVDLIDGGEV